MSLKTAAAVSYATDLATPSTLASLQGMHGGLYHGVGEWWWAEGVVCGQWLVLLTLSLRCETINNMTSNV